MFSSICSPVFVLQYLFSSIWKRTTFVSGIQVLQHSEFQEPCAISADSSLHVLLTLTCISADNSARFSSQLPLCTASANGFSLEALTKKHHSSFVRQSRRLGRTKGLSTGGTQSVPPTRPLSTRLAHCRAARIFKLPPGVLESAFHQSCRSGAAPSDLRLTFRLVAPSHLPVT